MQELQIYTGKIKFFQGSYGFITSEIGDVFFHTTGIRGDYFPFIEDDVIFQARNSNNGNNKLQAFNISLALSENISQVDGFLMIGVVQQYDHLKGYGIISTPFQVDIDGTSTIENVTYLFKRHELKTFIQVGDICSFRGVQKNQNKNIAQKCFKFDKFLATIVGCKSEVLSAIMDKYLYVAKNFDPIQIVEIARILKNNQQIRKYFLDAVYSKVNTFIKCKLCFQYNLLSLEKEHYTDLLNKFLSEVINKIENGAISITETPHLSQRVFTLKSEKELNPKVNVLGKIDLSTLNQSIKIKKAKHPLYESYKKVCDINLSTNIDTCYNHLKNIVNDGNFDYKVQQRLLKVIYEKCNIEYKYKLFEDNIITLDKKQQERLVLDKLASEIYNVGEVYDKIKDIANNENFETDIKQWFLKVIYEKADTEYKWKLSFEDKLVDLSKEEQDKLLQSVAEFGYVKKHYTQIKDIVSNIIDESVRQYFSNAIYENANIEYKYKLIFEDCLISLTKNQQLEFLGQYFLNDTDINNVWFYGQNPNVWKIRENYAKLCNFASNKHVNNDIRTDFLKRIYSEADITLQYKMLFEDCLMQFDFLLFIKDIPLLKELKKRDADKYQNYFEENYSQISKYDRLQLWLNGLNSHYNYLEFIQVAYKLTKDERKLFNMKVKEYAKDERLQSFLNQIPKAKLIDEDEHTKTYQCKWRNIYYKDGAVQIFLDRSTSTFDYKWTPAREEWNLLTQEYFNNRRIDNITVKVDNNNHVMTISGLETIEEKIKITEFNKKRRKGANIEHLSTEALSKLIHNVSARNQCVKFLSSQSSEFRVLDIRELVSERFGEFYASDISFLFPLPDNENNVFLVWESAEFEKSKATHIFKCETKDVENLENMIKAFLENTVQSRSKLNSSTPENIEIKKRLQYFGRVNHDSIDYRVWEDRMKVALPFLKTT